MRYKQILVTAVSIFAFMNLGCNSNSFSGSNGETSAAANQQPKTPSINTQPTINPLPTATPPQSIITPLPQGAVTQGSFTAWAFPSNPLPGQNYEIHIVVRLPSHITNYSKSDLNGSVIGTDGYRQDIVPAPTIFGSTMQTFNYMMGAAQAELVMYVPGAAPYVHDTINVRSMLLNESQVLSIIF